MTSFSSLLNWRRSITPLFFSVILIFICSNLIIAQTNAAKAKSQTQYWKTYSPNDVNFKISMPSEPFRSTFTTSFDDTEGVIYEAATYYASFRVLQIVVPPRFDTAFAKAHFDDFVEYGMQHLQKNIANMVRVSKKNLSTSKIAIYENIVEKDAITVRMKYYLSNRKIYVLAMEKISMPNTSPEIAAIYQSEADAFFNSFQILDNKTQVVSKTKGKAKK